MRVFNFWGQTSSDGEAYQKLPYLLFNPYNFLTIFLLLAITKVKKINSGLFYIVTLTFFLLAVTGIRYSEFPQFPVNFIRCFQFFFGIIVILMATYLLGRKIRERENIRDIIQELLSVILFIAACVTIIEFILFSYLRFPADNFYLNNLSLVERSVEGLSVVYFRPFGITSYPQANGLIISILVFLNYIYARKFNKYCYLGTIAVLMTTTGSGIGSFILFIPLLFRRTWMAFAIGIMILSVSIYFALLEIGGIFDKLSYAYLSLLFDMFQREIADNFHGFSAAQYLFGSRNPIFNTGSPSHDWAYMGVLYELGLFGLIVYIVFYSYILKWVLPANFKNGKKIYFVFVLMSFNFHYPTVNFYVSQFIFGTIAGLNLAQYGFSGSPKRRPVDRRCLEKRYNNMNCQDTGCI